MSVRQPSILKVERLTCLLTTDLRRVMGVLPHLAASLVRSNSRSLDPDPEPVIVQESNFHRTSVKTMDGIDISHATELLEPFEIPSAI
jgi:hypothetical protein